MDLTAFAEEVAVSGPVTAAGLGTRGGCVPGVRRVCAPSGIVELLPAEMTVRCGAGTPVDELSSELRANGQYAALPAGGTVGGALATGVSDVYRLGRGPVRDALLQVRYVSAEGRVIKAGGATVKNVSGFDLCRLMVGSRGTIGFIGEVILRTKPLPAVSQWFVSEQANPFELQRSIYRPSSLLWDGVSTWVCLEGHHDDVAEQAERIPGAQPIDGPPAIPTGCRQSIRPSEIRLLTGAFIAEVGVGIVHRTSAPADEEATPVAPEVVELSRRIKSLFDPTGRLNPGVDVLDTQRGSR